MKRRMFLLLALTLAPLALGACAAGGGGAGSTSTNRELLTAEDMAAYQAMDAYAVVRRLRSTWLNTRSTGSFGVDPDMAGSQTQIQVYIDGVRRSEGIEALKQISVNEIREIRHLDARDATMQYGTDHGAGAILVLTRGD